MGRNPSKSAGKTGQARRAGGELDGAAGGLTAGTAEMSRILGITPKWLRTIAKTGEVPKPLSTNPASVWDVAATVQGYVASIKRGAAAPEESDAGNQKAAELGLTIARPRKTELEAAIAAKELQKAEGSLLDRDEVAATWADICSTTRTRILTAPAKLAPRIMALRNVAEIERLVREELEEALAELSGAEVEFVPADAPEPEPRPAAPRRARGAAASA